MKAAMYRGRMLLFKMAAHEIDVFSLTDIAEIQQAYAQIHLHEVCNKAQKFYKIRIFKTIQNEAIFHVFSVCVYVSLWSGHVIYLLYTSHPPPPQPPTPPG